MTGQEQSPREEQRDDAGGFELPVETWSQTADTLRVLFVAGERRQAAIRIDQFDGRTATTPNAGMTALEADEFDCVVSAYDLPEGDGIVFLEAVREASPALPFVLVTTDATEALIDRAVSAGVTEYLQLDEADQSVLAEQIQRVTGKPRAAAIPEQPALLTSVLDPDGRLQTVNETAMDLVDTSQAAVTGDPLWEAPWWDEATRSQVRQWVTQAAHGETVEFEIEQRQPDGTPQRVVGVIRPLTNGLGEIDSLVASVRVAADTPYERLDGPDA